MDDYVIIEDAQSDNINSNFPSDGDTMHISQGDIWETIGKLIWGINYVPLDTHDKKSLYLIIIMGVLTLMILFTLVYTILKRMKHSTKQRGRVTAILKENTWLRYHEKKKSSTHENGNNKKKD